MFFKFYIFRTCVHFYSPDNNFIYFVYTVDIERLITFCVKCAITVSSCQTFYLFLHCVTLSETLLIIINYLILAIRIYFLLILLIKYYTWCYVQSIDLRYVQSIFIYWMYEFHWYTGAVSLISFLYSPLLWWILLKMRPTSYINLWILLLFYIYNLFNSFYTGFCLVPCTYFSQIEILYFLFPYQFRKQIFFLYYFI